jgi:hypothetical protein
MRSKLGAGILAGLLAAIPYGVIMSIATSPMDMRGGDSMGMGPSMPAGDREPMILMVANMIRTDSLAVAWTLLLLGGALMGLLFGGLFGDRPTRLSGWLLRGIVYGAAWWIGAGLVLMPVVLGMPALSPVTTTAMRGGAMIGLGAYLLSGGILGGVFSLLRTANRSSPRTTG